MTRPFFSSRLQLVLFIVTFAAVCGFLLATRTTGTPIAAHLNGSHPARSGELWLIDLRSGERVQCLVCFPQDARFKDESG